VSIRTDAPAPLDRASSGARAAAPVRIVHLGLGAFHRAHQAWYTDAVDADREWGIAAFTGRSPDAATTLRAQGGLYTVVERGESDRFHVVSSIVEANDGADLDRLCALVAAPTTAIVTITVTEAAYLLGSDGGLAADDPAVVADAATLAPTTMPGRLVRALAARRAAGAGPIAVVSCDNLPANGTAAHNAVVGMARLVDPAGGLADWIGANVSFVDTSVDRITPRATADDSPQVAEATGLLDSAPVVTEPFTSWVLSGAFPAGRPAWERAGAQFVDDIEPFERRKLWLLNGAHTLLAYAGSTRGHTTVFDAISDPVCAALVDDFWNEASAHLRAPGLAIDDYRAALLDRFGNARIAHHLAQIAADGSTKLRLRAVPVLRAERAEGRSGGASARLIAAWIDWAETATAPVDSRATDIATALRETGRARTTAMLAIVDAPLAGDTDVVDLVESLRATDRHRTTSFTEGNHP